MFSDSHFFHPFPLARSPFLLYNHDCRRGGRRMDKLKAYFLKNFEQTFVLVLLVSVALINYFVPYKLAFLNFYFIPVMLTAYYLDVRRALLGAVLCLIMVGVYFTLDPDSFI